MVLWASMRSTRPKLSFTSEFKFQFMKLRNWFCKGGPGLSSISFANKMSRSGNHRGTFLLSAWLQIWKTKIDNISVADEMESEKMSIQEIWKHTRAKPLETLGCKFIESEKFGQKCSKSWIQKLSRYSLKSKPCSTSKYNHKLGVGFKMGFTFFLNRLKLVLNVTKLTWLHKYIRMNQNRDTKPEPKSIIWAMSIQLKSIFTHFILNSLKFCVWGRGVGLGESIQLQIKNKDKSNINLFIELTYID